ncbi:NAD(P)/FAD-dependent oxidoreductase [Marinobacterium weihaiense]|uniref:FAD-binding oxidoreductase n=1 Tax=Marinobacterium weihaiense TaxID=2851016 RepID=A0ABS6MDZ5_9GAMM|nr:FAD-dependent oxidoreductase [Marinobacterium weihaiense]MBV0934499.1 FAD-binding oxidoreductase [Marinobacterium weihaiense]
MSREILVLGAGMVGVSIAWHLQQRGHRVTLVDRREPGRETSFGNAGLIQREAVRPYAFPRDLATLLRVLPNRAVDIRYRPGGMLQSARPLFDYWRNSAPARYRHIVPEYAALISRALDTHAQMIAAAEAEALMRRQGYLEVFRTAAALDAECRLAEQDAARFGVEHQVLSPRQLWEREPDLQADLAGAIHWTQPWSAVSPGDLVTAYARAFQAAGGRLLQAELQSLSTGQHGWQARVQGEVLDAEQAVLALGPWSAPWLAAQGIKTPLFVKRGYHMHYVPGDGARLNNWLMDAETGYLLAPMQAGIRLTTGAELARLDDRPCHQQLEAAEAVARTFFPLGKRLEPAPWLGGRPCLPDMKPIIGPVRSRPGLWAAFGHGHQGFTLGPLTGLLLGQMMDGETPELDMRPYRLERF